MKPDTMCSFAWVMILCACAGVSPQPSHIADRDVDALTEMQRRVQALETEQQKLLALTKSTLVAAGAPLRAASGPDQATKSGDLAQRALAIARMEAKIDQEIKSYNKRPRKKFVSARTIDAEETQYIELWRHKVETTGNLNYPEEAEGKLYGSLLLCVEIRQDGNLETVEVGRSSGVKLLDDAAVSMARLAAPYAPFSDELRNKIDIIGFCRPFSFKKGRDTAPDEL